MDMSEVELGSIPASPISSASLSRAGQRKTSNFFPVSSPSHSSISLSNTPLLGDQNDSNPIEHPKRHNSSPLVIASGNSMFFSGPDQSSSLHMSGNEQSVISTPIGKNGSNGLGMLGLDMGFDLSNSLGNLNFASSLHGPNLSFLSLSSPNISSGTLLQSSIWNDSKTATPKLDERSDQSLFSPFLSNDADLGISIFGNRSKSAGSNIYSSKVNNPSFLPSNTNGLDILSKNLTENALDETRELINKREHFAPTKKSYQVHEDILTNKIKKLDDRRYGQHNDNAHFARKGLIKKEETVVKLPNSLSTKVESNCFVERLINDRNKKYQEDYCSTFYKRNSHGYMFVKEPTNSLKVHNAGVNSWVQLKIRLPETSGRSAKKLKVDIKELPIWRPLTIGSSMSGGTKKFLKKASTAKDSKKFKYNNLSKKFGRRNE